MNLSGIIIIDTDGIVIEGCLKIEFAEETIELNAGEMYVVPKGVQHKPYADEECKIMLVEPKGVVNTGEADSNLTASNDVWFDIILLNFHDCDLQWTVNLLL